MIDCKYGKVFHRIRQDKGASLATAAAGIMSKQGLSAFENGKSMITLDKFFKLINQLNIDINEYIACITEQHLPKNNLNRLVMAYRRQDQHFLRQMQVKFKQWYAVYHREHDLHLMIVIKVLLKELGQQVNITTAEINTIHDYLLRVDQWGIYELRIFECTLTLFDDFQITLLSRTALTAGKAYDAIYCEPRKEICQLLFSLIERLLKLNQVKTAAVYLKVVRSELQVEDIQSWFLYRYYAGIVTYRLGQTQAKKAAVNTARLLAYLGNRNLAKHYLTHLADCGV